MLVLRIFIDFSYIYGSIYNQYLGGGMACMLRVLVCPWYKTDAKFIRMVPRVHNLSSLLVYVPLITKPNTVSIWYLLRIAIGLEFNKSVMISLSNKISVYLYSRCWVFAGAGMAGETYFLRTQTRRTKTSNFQKKKEKRRTHNKRQNIIKFVDTVNETDETNMSWKVIQF